MFTSPSRVEIRGGENVMSTRNIYMAALVLRSHIGGFVAYHTGPPMCYRRLNVRNGLAEVEGGRIVHHRRIPSAAQRPVE